MKTDAEKAEIQARSLLPHQQRVVEEKAALDEKLAKLLAFFDTPTYNDLPHVDRLLLIAQHTHMLAYSATLGTRIARF
jgi:hypothetical protein